MSSAGSGWTCSRCTFYHHAPGTRCAMCNELRVTKAQMRDFILGHPVPDDSAVSPRKKASTAASLAQRTLNVPPVTTTTKTTVIKPRHNPYKKNSAPAAKAQAVMATQPAPSTTALPAVETAAPSQTEFRSLPHNHPPTLATKGVATSKGVQRTLMGKVAAESAPRPNKAVAGPKAPPPFRSSVPRPVYQAGPVSICPDTVLDWIYPNDPLFPKRKYQFEMTRTALFHNTLVSLPTGLGKTLIAAVVLYNYYRWFPKGKVIFLAPTNPLVKQQVQACYSIMGVPATDTAVMTGAIDPEKRKLIWAQKRAFFCTPQTVQFDLDSQRLDAQKVVCLVLDEAHRGVKDYAYCKVIQQLEEAGARFRILALSATPGGTLAKIQEVIDTLRINKVEARLEDDPDVKQYIHDRHEEIIIVPQGSATRSVDRLISDIIGPLLDRLRSAGALKHVGNATMTGYSLICAKQLYEKKTGGDKSMIGYFAASHTFVEIRTNLHKHGIGMVRGKLARLRNERQTGIVSKVIKEKAFQVLWDHVTESSYDPQSMNQSAERKAMNNPKLSKLREILMEHFERARATEKSSRAIVFSQFRDSVSEIVDLLKGSQPLIRPRHFVGQGKGAKTDKGGHQVKGMKQIEQHQAIRQFRDDVFNVLVCTSIGEEGLDIGEVDLIVNFDTIGSATRMVQRVGRTGRKRSGRVVGLVSEGAEERQLAKAKQSGRNLAHALRNPTSFQVLPTIPLLHSTPTLLEQNMQISQRFRMSQVEGHGGAGAGDSGKTSGSEPRKSLAWRLSDDAETRRAAVMGSSNSVCLPKSDGFPRELKKRFLTARLHQSNHGKKLSRRLGRVSSILMAFDSETRVGVIDRFGKKRRRALNATESYVDVVFPLSSSNEENFKMAAWGSAVERRKCKPPVEASSHQRENSAQVDTKSTCNDVKRKTKPPVKVISQQREKLAQVETRPTCNGVLESRRETMGEPTRNKVNSRDRKKPVQVGADVSFSGREANSTKGDEAPWKVNACERENSARAMEDSRVHASLSSNNEGGGILPVTSNESIHSQYCARTLEAVNKVGENRSRQAESSRKEHIPPTGQVSNEEWMLPTPPSSSDEESMSVESKRVAPKVIPDLTAKRTATLPSIPVDTFSLPSQDSSSDEGTFSLPSQDSSSDESDPNEKLHAVVPAHQASKGVFPAQRTVNDSNGILAEGEKASAQPRNARERTTQTMTYVPECGRLIGRRSVAKGDNEDGPVRTKPRKLRRAIEDSQESPAVGPSNENLKFRQKGRTTRKFIDDESSPGSFDRRSSTGTKSVARSDQLVDTQVSPTSDENVDDIVCAICSSGESPDEDPIVLCDGPGGTVTCNVAVHASCYAASIDFTKNEDWRCEVCEYKVGGGTIKPRCYICHEGSGALTRFFGNEWIHPACKSVAAAEQGGKPEGQSRDIGHSNEHTRKRRRLAVRATRKRNYESFFDEEARIASDEDVDGDEGDEEHIRDIEEEEEFYGGFINDSSQLDFTQDALDKVDPEEEGGHRALDATRARANVFATPVLNRQVRQPAGARWSDAHSSAPSSLRGLGQMRFIRSVLEHHREGGEADEIEEAFRRLEGQGTPADEAAVRPLPPEVERKVVVYHESDSDE